MAGAKKEDAKPADKGQVAAKPTVESDAKPAGADKPQELPKVDKRKKTDGKTCRQSLFDFVRSEPFAPKHIIKAVVEETGCAPATVRTHINKMLNEGNLRRSDTDGVGYIYQVDETGPMQLKVIAAKHLAKAEIKDEK